MARLLEFNWKGMFILNRCACRRIRPSAASGLLILTMLAVLALPVPARAQFNGNASATSQFESNSNIFALDSGAAQPATDGYNRSTTDFAYGAAFNGTYAWSRQQLYASASAKNYDYQQLSVLNHTEYNLDTGLRWELGEQLDGKLDVARTRAMVPFLDLSGSTLPLTLLTEQIETIQIGYKLNSDWRLEGSGYTSNSTQSFAPGSVGLNEPPLSGMSSQQLTQNSGTATIKYTGIGPLTSGVTVGYANGDSGSLVGAVDSSYRQYTAGFVGNYSFNRTSFDGEIGYTRRNQDDGGGNTSGLTGLIDFKDQLTPKTSFSIKIQRAVQTLYLNLGSEVDSDAGVSVAWQATYKIAGTLGYTFTYRAFPGQAVGAAGAYPVDYEQSANIAFSYQPLRWLSITAYGNFLTRSSNTFGQNFDSNVYGITLTGSVGDAGVKR
jgi:hypothetical protein